MVYRFDSLCYATIQSVGRLRLHLHNSSTEVAIFDELKNEWNNLYLYLENTNFRPRNQRVSNHKSSSSEICMPVYLDENC